MPPAVAAARGRLLDGGDRTATDSFCVWAWPNVRGRARQHGPVERGQGGSRDGPRRCASRRLAAVPARPGVLPCFDPGQVETAAALAVEARVDTGPRRRQFPRPDPPAFAWSRRARLDGSAALENPPGRAGGCARAGGEGSGRIPALAHLYISTLLYKIWAKGRRCVHVEGDDDGGRAQGAGSLHHGPP